VFERRHIPIKQQFLIVLGLLCVLIVVEAINILSLRQLNTLGILPRSWDHLSGIVFAPFLHGSLMHFAANIIPLAVFSFLLLQHGVRRYVLVTSFVIVVGGGMVWMFARNAIHIGASGVVFGYFGFLVLAGFISIELKLIAISLFVSTIYGGFILGVFLRHRGMSW